MDRCTDRDADRDASNSHTADDNQFPPVHHINPC
jgi:hypothetical protein